MISLNLKKENVIYQFRPISRKITDCDGNVCYKDLERLKNREIYFSPLEQLNDPLDGKVYFVWNGDKKVWKGMIYHYTNLLFTRLFLVCLGADLSEVKKLNVSGYMDKNLPYKNVLRQSLIEFFDTDVGKNILEQLSSQHKFYIEDVILFFNSFVHHEILRIILTSSLSSAFCFTDQALNFLLKVPTKENSPMNILSKKDEIPNELLLFSHAQISFLHELAKTKSNSLIYIKSLFCESFFKNFQSSALFQWGISSFSLNCSHPLMWSHYAESHKGICLIFEINNEHNTKFSPHHFFEKDDMDYYLHNSAIGHEIVLSNISYIKELPEYNIFNALEQFTHGTADEIFSFYDDGIDSFCSREDRISSIEELSKKVFFQKTPYWGYEEEVRMVMSGLHERYGRKTTMKFILSRLKGVIFGINTSIDDKLRVIATLEEMYKNEEEKPEIYQAIYSQKENIINVTPLTFVKFIDGFKELQ